MKHEITTFNTKKTIAASLKKFMEKKPLSKITVSEIVADCKINRKTFYYHFENIQELLKWMLEQEAIEVVKNFDLLLDYEDAINFVLDYVEENKHILNCAYDSIGSNELNRFFHNDFNSIVMTIINRYEEIMGIEVDNNFRIFICDFYTEAIVGMIVRLLKNKNPYDRHKLIEYVSLTIKSSLPTVLKEAVKERHELRML